MLTKKQKAEFIIEIMINMRYVSVDIDNITINFIKINFMISL